MIFVYFNLMFMIFINMMIFSLGFFYFNFSLFMEWTLFAFNSVNMEIVVLIDWISILFVGFVMLISSMIILYSYVYMHDESNFYRFIFLVILFVFSMIIMILSPNLISILFGWDCLGLVSYCLVVYYHNYVSLNSGMVTVLCNRVGDVGILMSIGLLMMKGSWNFWMIDGSVILVVMFIILASITKSAQIPFSTWLPMAMAAPTPVSALVHSSTLVTAGVYLMIRFNKYLFEGSINYVLLFLSVLTMFMSGLMANIENDLKKIIALSTLSQLGLMMMILSVGSEMIAFYHLLTHAIFKSMLFMCAGIMIHSMMNIQDIRLFGNLSEMIPFTSMAFFISSFSLCGGPFLAGFYSKDLIMELIFNDQLNIFLVFLSLVSLIFTATYSVRVYYYMFFGNMKFYSYYNLSETFLMNFSMIILILMSVVVGSLLNWMFFFDYYFIYSSAEIKFMILGCLILGISLSGMWKFYVLINKFFFLSYYFSSMWFLNYLYMLIYKPVNFIGIEGGNFDKTWVEFSCKNLIYAIINFMNMKFFKIYMFIYLFAIILILNLFMF